MLDYRNLSLSNKAIIKAYEKGYRISEGGDVISYTGKIRKPVYDTRGYQVFTFGMNYNKIPIQVHRFQAYQKFGDSIFDINIHVRHLDNNSTNNSWDNIAIGSPSDNMMDKSLKTRRNAAITASSNIRSLTDEQIKDLRNLREEGWTYPMLMERFDVKSKGSMWEFLNRDYVTKK